MDRSEVIRANVARVEERIAGACARAGRDRSEITLVAVSKRFPVEDIARAYDAGVRHFGENRVQELVEKMNLWDGRYPDRPITWHMVGHLQRNKVKSIVGRVPLFHGLDSLRLAEAISRIAIELGTTWDCLVQVNVSEEETKFGFDAEEVIDRLTEMGSLGGVSVRGLMTLAHPVEDPEEVRPELAKLRRLLERSQSETRHPLTVLSMGMTGDFEVAIEEGSTHVRLGTVLFGERT
jgi:pyridoxal phosphate enzyme (YggS family)